MTVINLPAGFVHGHSSNSGKQLIMPFTWIQIRVMHPVFNLVGLIWLEQSVYMMRFLSECCLILLFPALLLLSDRCITAVMKEFLLLMPADLPTQRDVIGAVKPRGGGGVLKTSWPSWLDHMSGGLGKSPVMPHERLHLPQSRFIASLFFCTVKVYCSIIWRSCPDFGFCLLNTIFSVTARGLSGDYQKVSDASLCVVVLSRGCIAPFYLLSLAISVSFCLYYHPTASFICPFALITIKTFLIDAFIFPASAAFLSVSCFAGRRCHQHKTAVNPRDVIQVQVAPEIESQSVLASICTPTNTTATAPCESFMRLWLRQLLLRAERR